jgi:hypothetical protein
MSDSVSKEKIVEFKDYVKALKEEMYSYFSKTKSLARKHEDLFMETVEKIRDALPECALENEMEMILKTSYEDAELIRNIDYLLRVLEDAVEDLSDGDSPWLEKPKRAKSRKAFTVPMPDYFSEQSKPIWEKAVKKLEEEGSVFNEDGSLNVDGVLVQYVSLLEDEIDKAETEVSR